MHIPLLSALPLSSWVLSVACFARCLYFLWLKGIVCERWSEKAVPKVLSAISHTWYTTYYLVHMHSNFAIFDMVCDTCLCYRGRRAAEWFISLYSYLHICSACMLVLAFLYLDCGNLTCQVHISVLPCDSSSLKFLQCSIPTLESPQKIPLPAS